MTALAEKVMETALELSPADRAELMHRLFISFDPPPDPSVDEAWAIEVESRLDAYHAGKMEASSAEDVFDRISKL
ncbi:MAG: addiction module protein [Pontiellaceae bacterium]|nr:addiction module protein [Pontiellaceae bacterium]